MNTNIRYKNKSNKTNKSKKYKKRYSSFYTRKRGGATSLNEEQKVQPKEVKEPEQKESEVKESKEVKEPQPKEVVEENNKEAIEEIKQQVQDEKNINILGKTGEIAEGVAVNAISNVGNLMGIDLEDPNLIQENKEKIQKISKNVAELGSIVVESVEPFTKPLIDKSIKAGEEAASKIAESGVKVILNTAEEIPGVGIVIGTIRSIGNVGDAIVSSVNAGSEVITSASDTINESVKNFDRLIKEKSDILNRTKASIDEFTGGYKTKKNRNNRRMKRKTRKVF
jgi:hypothetical protein